MNKAGFEFIPPPEAPVFEPTWEEFQNPLLYIEKIKPIAERTGICKIIPPARWNPPFSVDQEQFKFVPRLQRLNELEAKTRVKLNFLEHLSKFWELQGTQLKIPTIDKKYLDLYDLQKLVHIEGGYEPVCDQKLWRKMARCLGLTPVIQGRCTATIIAHHYKVMIHPYDLFVAGKKQEMSEMADINMMLKFEDAKKAIYKSTSSSLGSYRNTKTEARKPTNGKSEMKQPTNGKTEVNKPINGKIEVKEEDADMDIKKEELSANSDAHSTDEEDSEVKKKSRKDKELSKLQFKGAGPKNITPEGERQPKPKHLMDGDEKPTKRVTREQKAVSYNQVELYHCLGCGSGDDEELMLLCDGCDDAFHIFCLEPPLPCVPKGDWRCPCCIAKLCSKPSEAYGFEQSTRQYTLKTFGEMADRFKIEYFDQPTHLVPCSSVEREFWRLVSSTDDEVVVKYGADVHSMDMGSGFPMKENDQDSTEYMDSGWNLNNLPVLKQSVLQHISADISGMKVPWCYVGMCFSCFCWHTEDHWSYSINYIHWGEPKTWYGVPGSKAELFEECVRHNAPELFEQCPDLLHQLTTTMNPNQIQTFGIPIVRTDQNAGEFVVTFPRSYHAGFNQGFNFAEAVNFCPADWLPFGRACIQHYQDIRRQCVFSHEELICKMAIEAERLDIKVANCVYADMLVMIDNERKQRQELSKDGIVKAEREAFELLPDDARQCCYCKTTCFISAISCPCTKNIACIIHSAKLCDCKASKKCLRYRYTLNELPSMLQKLKDRAESYNEWKAKVETALSAPAEDKLDDPDDVIIIS